MTEVDARFAAVDAEFAVALMLERGARSGLPEAARDAFLAASFVPLPEDPILAAERLLRIGCIAMVADMKAEFRRFLDERSTSHPLPVERDELDWGCRVWVGALDLWLRIFSGDPDLGLSRMNVLRKQYPICEAQFLDEAERRKDASAPLLLACAYHAAIAGEVLASFGPSGQQGVVRELNEAIEAARSGNSAERESLLRLLAQTLRHKAFKV
jgi:hypothetical protein